MAILPQAEQPQQLVHLRIENVAAQSTKAPGELEILATGEVLIEVRFLGDVADAPLEGFHVLHDVLAVKQDLALRRLDETGEHLDRGALPGAVRSEIAENLAGLDREADAVHDGDSAVALFEVAYFQHGFFGRRGTGGSSRVGESRVSVCLRGIGISDNIAASLWRCFRRKPCAFLFDGY